MASFNNNSNNNAGCCNSTISHKSNCNPSPCRHVPSSTASSSGPPKSPGSACRNYLMSACPCDDIRDGNKFYAGSRVAGGGGGGTEYPDALSRCNSCGGCMPCRRCASAVSEQCCFSKDGVCGQSGNQPCCMTTVCGYTNAEAYGPRKTSPGHNRISCCPPDACAGKEERASPERRICFDAASKCPARNWSSANTERISLDATSINGSRKGIAESERFSLAAASVRKGSADAGKINFGGTGGAYGVKDERGSISSGRSGGNYGQAGGPGNGIESMYGFPSADVYGHSGGPGAIVDGGLPSVVNGGQPEVPEMAAYPHCEHVNPQEHYFVAQDMNCEHDDTAGPDIIDPSEQYDAGRFVYCPCEFYMAPTEYRSAPTCLSDNIIVDFEDEDDVSWACATCSSRSLDNNVFSTTNSESLCSKGADLCNENRFLDAGFAEDVEAVEGTDDACPPHCPCPCKERCCLPAPCGATAGCNHCPAKQLVCNNLCLWAHYCRGGCRCRPHFGGGPFRRSMYCSNPCSCRNDCCGPCGNAEPLNALLIDEGLRTLYAMMHKEQPEPRQSMQMDSEATTETTTKGRHYDTYADVIAILKEVAQNLNSPIANSQLFNVKSPTDSPAAQETAGSITTPPPPPRDQEKPSVQSSADQPPKSPSPTTSLSKIPQFDADSPKETERPSIEKPLGSDHSVDQARQEPSETLAEPTGDHVQSVEQMPAPISQGDKDEESITSEEMKTKFDIDQSSAAESPPRNMGSSSENILSSALEGNEDAMKSVNFRQRKSMVPPPISKGNVIYYPQKKFDANTKSDSAFPAKPVRKSSPEENMEPTPKVDDLEMKRNTALNKKMSTVIGISVRAQVKEHAANQSGGKDDSSLPPPSPSPDQTDPQATSVSQQSVASSLSVEEPPDDTDSSDSDDMSKVALEKRRARAAKPSIAVASAVAVDMFNQLKNIEITRLSK